jgi:HlyD family secretion protein
MKRFIAIIVIAAAIAAGLVLYYSSNGKEARFKTQPVVVGSIRLTVTATGTVNAVTNVKVGTQVSGTIEKLYVDFNSMVKKGQVIAEIDPTSFKAQVDQARANVLAAKANVEKMRATMIDSARTRDRNRELVSKNLIARSEADTSEANYDANKAALAAASAQVSQMEAALRFAETNLTYTRIVSPVDGIIVSRDVDVGQTVAASFQTPTLFTIAQDLTKMQINTNVDEADIGKIETGQQVEFTVDAYPEITFSGIVDQVRIAPITVQNVVTYDVVVKMDNPDMKLKPGMTANVSIVVTGKDRALKVPNAALRFRLEEKDQTATTKRIGASESDTSITKPKGEIRTTQDRSGSSILQRIPGGRKPSTVWILMAGKPKKTIITTGISDGAYTEVMSGELQEGQQVITESLNSAAKNSNGSSGTPRPPRFL